MIGTFQQACDTTFRIEDVPWSIRASQKSQFLDPRCGSPWSTKLGPRRAISNIGYAIITMNRASGIDSLSAEQNVDTDWRSATFKAVAWWSLLKKRDGRGKVNHTCMFIS